MKKLLIFPILFLLSCSTEPEDCAGDEGGTAERDNCEVCDTDATNDCVQDCAGVWGGLSYEDGCGDCDVNVTNDNTACVKDCAGIWGGTALNDECGICNEPICNNIGIPSPFNPGNNPCEDGEFPISTLWNNNCLDCANYPNGEASYDDCGVCDNDQSNDCVQD